MSSCGKDEIIKMIIAFLEETGALTSREIIEGIERMAKCSATPTLIREVLAYLVRDGVVLRVPGSGRNKNVFVFRLNPQALEAIQ